MRLIRNILLAACLALPTLTFAAVSASKIGPAGPVVMTFDPGDVTTGTAVSVDIDTSYFKSMNCQYRNPDGATRTFTSTCKNNAGATTYTYTPSISVTTGSTAEEIWDPLAASTVTDGVATGSAAVPANTYIHRIQPCRQVNIAAPAASGPAGVVCTLRAP